MEFVRSVMAQGVASSLAAAGLARVPHPAAGVAADSTLERAGQSSSSSPPAAARGAAAEGGPEVQVQGGSCAVATAGPPCTPPRAPCLGHTPTRLGHTATEAGPSRLGRPAGGQAGPAQPRPRPAVAPRRRTSSKGSSHRSSHRPPSTASLVTNSEHLVEWHGGDDTTSYDSDWTQTASFTSRPSHVEWRIAPAPVPAAPPPMCIPPLVDPSPPLPSPPSLTPPHSNPTSLSHSHTHSHTHSLEDPGSPPAVLPEALPPPPAAALTAQPDLGPPAAAGHAPPDAAGLDPPAAAAAAAGTSSGAAAGHAGLCLHAPPGPLGGTSSSSSSKGSPPSGAAWALPNSGVVLALPPPGAHSPGTPAALQTSQAPFTADPAAEMDTAATALPLHAAAPPAPPCSPTASTAAAPPAADWVSYSFRAPPRHAGLPSCSLNTQPSQVSATNSRGSSVCDSDPGHHTGYGGRTAALGADDWGRGPEGVGRGQVQVQAAAPQLLIAPGCCQAVGGWHQAEEAARAELGEAEGGQGLAGQGQGCSVSLHEPDHPEALPAASPSPSPSSSPTTSSLSRPEQQQADARVPTSFASQQEGGLVGPGPGLIQDAATLLVAAEGLPATMAGCQGRGVAGGREEKEVEGKEAAGCPSELSTPVRGIAAGDRMAENCLTAAAAGLEDAMVTPVTGVAESNTQLKEETAEQRHPQREPEEVKQWSRPQALQLWGVSSLRVQLPSSAPASPHSPAAPPACDSGLAEVVTPRALYATGLCASPSRPPAPVMSPAVRSGSPASGRGGVASSKSGGLRLLLAIRTGHSAHSPGARGSPARQGSAASPSPRAAAPAPNFSLNSHIGGLVSSLFDDDDD
ncbi:hypothetical protein V8C86DRAFT_672720 [Haematococcus lacustris]